MEKKNTIARYRVELLVEAGDDKSLFVAFDSAMTKLTGIRAAEVVMEVIEASSYVQAPSI